MCDKYDIPYPLKHFSFKAIKNNCLNNNLKLKIIQEFFLISVLIHTKASFFS